MANIIVSAPLSNVTVDSTTSTVNVSQTTSNIIVGETLVVSNSVIRSAISNTFPILFDTSTGVISIDEDAIVDETVVNNGTLSGNITLDLDAGRLHQVTLGGNITGINFANIASGRSATVIFTQDGLGGAFLDTTTTPSNWTSWNFASGATDFDTNALAWTVLSVFYDGSEYYASLVLEQATSIGTADIQDGAITTAKLANDSVTTAKLANDSVTTSEIADGAVTNPKLANSNIVINGTAVDLGGNISVTANMDLTALSVTENAPSGNGSLSYSNITGVFTFTPADTSNAGIQLTALSVTENAPSGNGTLSYNNTTGVFSFTPADVPDTTDELTEGVTNLYYSNTRVNAFIQDSITTSDIDEGTNLYYSNARVNAFIQDSITTSDIDEGTNLYYTTGRANTAISTYFNDSGNAPYVFAGNVEVQGNLNYQNVTDLYVTDQKITLNANAASDATVEIIANRPVAGANTILRWNETSDIWEFTNDGSTYYPIPTSTSDLAEGTNLYWTTDRGNAMVEAFQGNINTAGNITADIITATTEFLGDLDGAISVGVFNNTASTLTKGQAVYITGAQGDEANVAPANNQIAAQMPAMGIIKDNISAGASGQAVTNGTMNFAGHGFTIGADLYVNGAGLLTETIPTGEGELLQKIGKALAPNFILVQGAGRTNQTPNLNEGNIFLGNASNRAVSAVLDTSIVPENGNLYYTTDRANSAILNYTGDITQMGQANISRLYVGEDDIGLDQGLVNLHDFQMIKEDIYFDAKQLNRNGSSGLNLAFLKGGGTVASPANNIIRDRLVEFDYWGYNPSGTGFTAYLNTAGMWAYHDVDPNAVANVIPIAHEFWVREDGDYYGKSERSVMALRSDRTITFNDTTTRGTASNGNGGNANITADGTINTVSNINASGNISGTNFIGDLTGNLIATTTTAVNIDATGTVTGNSLLLDNNNADTSISVVINDSSIRANLDLSALNLANTLNHGYITFQQNNAHISSTGSFTTNGNINVSGDTNLNVIQSNDPTFGNITFRSNAVFTTHSGNGNPVYLGFGTNGNGLNIHYDGSNSYISPNVGELKIEGGGSLGSGNVTIGNPSAVFGLRNLKYDYDNNRLGIGTGDNVGVAADGGGMFGAVHILSDNSTNARINLEENRNTNSGPDLRFYKSRGTYSAPSDSIDSDVIRGEFHYVYNTGDSGYGNSRSRYEVYVDNKGGTGILDSANGAVPLSHQFMVSPSGNSETGAGLISGMKITYEGDVEVGQSTYSTSNTANIILSRSGNITATETITGGNLTVAGISYPYADGSNGQVLTTDGAGTLSFTNAGAVYGNVDVENFLSANVVTANIETQGNIVVNQDITAIGDVSAANAIFANKLYSYTPGGTFTMTALRVTDFKANDPLGIASVANSALTTGPYASPFTGAIAFVTGDRSVAGDGLPAYWSGTSWRYFDTNGNVTI